MDSKLNLLIQETVKNYEDKLKKEVMENVRWIDTFDFKKYNKTCCSDISEEALDILSKYYGRTMTQKTEYSSTDDDYGYNVITFGSTIQEEIERHEKEIAKLKKEMDQEQL